MNPSYAKNNYEGSVRTLIEEGLRSRALELPTLQGPFCKEEKNRCGTLRTDRLLSTLADRILHIAANYLHRCWGLEDGWVMKLARLSGLQRLRWRGWSERANCLSYYPQKRFYLSSFKLKDLVPQVSIYCSSTKSEASDTFVGMLDVINTKYCGENFKESQPSCAESDILPLNGTPRNPSVALAHWNTLIESDIRSLFVFSDLEN